MPSNQRSSEYKERFNQNLTNLFRNDINQYASPDSILTQWTFNFDSEDSVFFLRVANFVNSLLRTEEMD
jgi:hypothetical protein